MKDPKEEHALSLDGSQT